MVFCSHFAFGQSATDLNTSFRWDHLTVADGLPSREVYCIIQDSIGFMWFGTPEGLVRYDGYSMVVFTHNPNDSMSLSGNDITALAVDSSGNLWVGTTNGLNRINPFSGKAIRFLKCDSKADSFPDNHIRALLIDSQQRMWVETAGGTLNLFNRADGSIKTYRHQPVTQVYYRYHQIYEDSRGMLWVAGRNIPPIKFDPIKEKFSVFPTSRTDRRYKRESDGACYIEDSNGNLLMGGLDGLYRLNSNDGTVQKIHSNSTFSLISGDDGSVWAATGSGIYRHFADSTPPGQLTHDDDIAWSLIHNYVNVIFRDASGCIWAGTSDGISRWAPSKHKFKWYTHLTGKDNSLISPRVNVMVSGGDGILWIGTDGRGIDRFNLSAETFRHFTPENTPGMKGGKIRALFIDRNKVLWAGLWNGTGFGQLNEAKGKFNLYSFDSTTQLYDWYNDFEEDERGNFYVGFWGANGVAWFDRTKKLFVRSFNKNRPDIVASRLTIDLMCDRLGKIWIGTFDNGFSIYNPWSDKMTSITEGDGGFPEEGVNAFFEDSKGRIWIAAKGLYRYFQSTQQFINISAWCQFPAKAFYAITEDDNNMLWFNTDHGLIRFNPEDYSFAHFTEEDGLQSNQFTKAACRLSDGRLALGGSNGFNLFDPSVITTDNFVPAMAITGLIINGKTYLNGDPQERLLHLHYHENFITIRFSAFDYNNPGKIQYSYQLVGFNHYPVVIGQGDHEAILTNIPPGNYSFIVRSTNAGGQWVDNRIICDVIITPPFWITGWFNTLVVLILGVGLYWLVRNRSEKARIKEDSVELQQKLLRSRMNPHFIFNSLFAIQNFIYTNSTDAAGRYLSDFALLMRRILDQSAEDFIPLEQEIKTLELYLKLQLLRFSDRYKADLLIEPTVDVNEIFVPPMLVQPFVENAIEHGIMNRIDGLIRIEFAMMGKGLSIIVTDNGVGMPLNHCGDPVTHSKRTHALQITHDRIALLNEKYATRITMEIGEVYPGDLHFPGTRIELFIPSHTKTNKICFE
ncbi:MAG: hypothetical protein CVU06_00070 [Bacteroidetes bacterium HGW-Bacteroidetes-22]|nr:MAG: hypothetical protein CVU06_00070 [Bacteroidetes bacterium HGW-Bacteroidetes-22]